MAYLTLQQLERHYGREEVAAALSRPEPTDATNSIDPGGPGTGRGNLDTKREPRGTRKSANAVRPIGERCARARGWSSGRTLSSAARPAARSGRQYHATPGLVWLFSPRSSRLCRARYGECPARPGGTRQGFFTPHRECPLDAGARDGNGPLAQRSSQATLNKRPSKPISGGTRIRGD